MKLNLIRNTDLAIKQTKILAFSFGVILLVGFSIAIVLTQFQLEDAYNKSFIFDNKGKVYETSMISTADMREYEYENHVKNFFLQWYTFDEYTYEQNIKEGLELIGDRGKELLNEYNDVDILNSMIQKNIRYGATISEIKVNMNTIPISGIIKGTQTGYRAKGSVSRNIEVNFTLYDVNRSRKNVHGCKIDMWNHKYTSPNNE